MHILLQLDVPSLLAYGQVSVVFTERTLSPTLGTSANRLAGLPLLQDLA